MTDLSVVIPAYNNKESIKPLIHEIQYVVKQMKISYEVIFVDDCSPDNLWDQLKTIATTDVNIKCIRLSRNYGQHAAITAGIAQASGRCVVVMDCDLQDHPKYIPQLYAKFQEGFHVVFTSKVARKHGFLKNVTAKMFFIVFNALTDQKKYAQEDIGSYTLLSRTAYEAFLRFKDVHRHYLVIVRNLGFKAVAIEIEHQKRQFGKSSYTIKKLIIHAINGIVSQSNIMLYFAIAVGLIYFILAIAGAIYYAFMYFVFGSAPGFTTLTILLLFSTGLILTFLGLIGLYIAKIFDQVRERPLYLIEDSLNFPKHYR